MDIDDAHATRLAQKLSRIEDVESELWLEIVLWTRSKEHLRACKTVDFVQGVAAGRLRNGQSDWVCKSNGPRMAQFAVHKEGRARWAPIEDKGNRALPAERVHWHIHDPHRRLDWVWVALAWVPREPGTWPRSVTRDRDDGLVCWPVERDSC